MGASRGGRGGDQAPPAPPTGERYSLVYLERGQPTRDSARFRRRVGHYFLQNLGDLRAGTAQMLQSELGADLPHAYNGYAIDEFFERCELRDLLDGLSVVFQVAKATEGALRTVGMRNGWAERWLTFVRRALEEENVGYTMDDRGGIHPRVDQEFERNRVATVAALQHPDLANALAEHENAFRHFEAQHQDTKAAVRSIFETVEIVAKVICPESQRLNRVLIDGALREACLRALPEDVTERSVLASMFDSLNDWVTGLHKYRHGQGLPEPVAPSEELTVWALSTGSAYARLLAGCYARLGPSN